jgi:hypothetical protein
VLHRPLHRRRRPRSQRHRLLPRQPSLLRLRNRSRSSALTIQAAPAGNSGVAAIAHEAENLARVNLSSIFIDTLSTTIPSVVRIPAWRGNVFETDCTSMSGKTSGMNRCHTRTLA